MSNQKEILKELGITPKEERSEEQEREIEEMHENLNRNDNVLEKDIGTLRVGIVGCGRNSAVQELIKQQIKSRNESK